MNKNQVSTAQNFGEFFRSKRIILGLTLRTFCERFGYDPGNISRLERNILSPTIDRQKLEGYATALKIPRDGEEWVTFFDLAHIAKGQIPGDIQNNQSVARFLPAFYRSVRGERLTKEKIKKLIDLLNQANIPHESE